MCRIYFGLIWNPGVQALFLVVSAMLLGFLAYSASKLAIDNELMQLYVGNHPLSMAKWKKERIFAEPSFSKYGQSVQLYFVWGIKDLDRSRCHKTDWKHCHGDVVWDEHFDLNQYHAQGDLLWWCQYLKNLPKPTLRRLHARLNIDGKLEMDCFLEELDDFFMNKGHGNGLPIKESHVQQLMQQHPDVYEISAVKRNPFFNRYFETALLYWLNDGYNLVKNVISFPSSSKTVKTGRSIHFPSTQHAHITSRPPVALDALHKYGQLIGNSINSSDLQESKPHEETQVTYGSKLRYVTVTVNTTFPMNVSYTDGLHVLEEWEKLFQDAKTKMAPSLQSGFVVTPGMHGIGAGIHHWMKFQKAITTTAIQGILISLLIAFPVLVLSTDDFMLGTLATLMICCTTISVIGVIPLAGWKLGILESLNLTLVVGLAIDYIVHVAEAYHLSKQSTRKLKVQEILNEVGISVLSGAFSTLGASFFLLFAKIVFFMQFGLFIFCTVGFSLFFSLGMFIVLLALVGPETDTFSVSKFFLRQEKSE